LIRTSHVGSFPLNPGPGVVGRVLRDLREVGLDAPPYPQLRSFIEIYVEPLVKAGVAKDTGGFYTAEPRALLEFKPPDPFIPEAVEAIRVVREEGLGFKWLRAPVTGPLTLASRIYLAGEPAGGLEHTVLRDKELVMQVLTPYVAGFARYLEGLGYNIVFIDEPVLGVIVGARRILLGYTVEDLREIYGELFKGLRSERGIHVCGRIPRSLFGILASIDELDILNFEFHDSPENIDVVDGSLLEKNDKVLAPGVASSKKLTVESTDEILGLLSRVHSKAMGRIDLVSADCGFGGLKEAGGNSGTAYNVGLAKLRNIVKAVHVFDESGKAMG